MDDTKLCFSNREMVKCFTLCIKRVDGPIIYINIVWLHMLDKTELHSMA